MAAFALIDEPRRGVENMAVDQQLLELAADRDLAILRLYQWAQPTLTLGYFQPWRDREQHLESIDLPLVRRASGGGAIVHHHDWTYSVCLPASRLASSMGAVHAVYTDIHGEIIRWLQELGLSARAWEGSDCEVAQGHAQREGRTLSGKAREGKCAFLCFERRAAGDIVVDASESGRESKVLGSAQRRFDGAVLQHGSLLLQRSPHAPTLSGIQDLANQQLSCEEWNREMFFQRLTAVFARISGQSVDRIEKLAELVQPDAKSSQFSDIKWTKKR